VNKTNIFSYKDFHVILYRYRPAYAEQQYYYVYYPKSLVYWRGLLIGINKAKNVYSHEEHCGRLAREYVASICKIPSYNLLFTPQRRGDLELSMTLEDYEV
jgi:hypothetical protein